MKVAKKPQAWLRIVLVYGVAAVFSAATVGAVVAALGSLMRPILSTEDTMATLAVATAFFGLSDLRALGLRTPSPHRQTSPVWLIRYGSSRTFFLWGLDLGAGFTTIRVTSLYWAAALATALLVPLAVAPAVMALYGVALTISLAVSLSVFRNSSDLDRPGFLALSLRRRVASLAGLYLVGTSVLSLLVWALILH